MGSINPKIFDKVNGDVFGVQMLSDDSPCYDPCTKYSTNTTSDKRHGQNSKHNWFKHGKDDLVPYVLRQLYRDSGKHNSIINTKAQMVSGAGFDFSQPENFCIRDEDGFYIETPRLLDSELEAEVKQARLWAKNVLLRNYQVDASRNLMTYGGYYGLRYVERGRNPKTFRAEGINPYLRRLKIEPYTNMRLSTDRDFINERFDSVFHYISSDWSIANNTKVYDYEKFIVKADNNKGAVGLLLADDNNAFVQDEILSKHVFRNSEYRDYYGTPDYESREVLNYITIDYLSSVYNLEGIKGGFPLEYIIVKYRKQLDEKEEIAKRQQEVNQMRQQHKGAAGKRTMMMWAEPKVNVSGDVSNVPPIQIIEVPHNTNPERFDSVLKERLTSVLGGHGMITSEIASLPTLSSTGFSSQSEMLITAIDTLYWNRIRPAQMLIEQDINDELIRTGFNLKATTKNDIPSFKRVCDELASFSKVLNELSDFNIEEETKNTVANEVINKIQNELRKV